MGLLALFCEEESMFSQQRSKELARALFVFGIEAQVRVQKDGTYCVQIGLQGETYNLEWETQVAQINIKLSQELI
jgi:hypothetical protein